MPNSELKHVLDGWRKQAATAGYSQERIKGTAFEKLCIAFLTHDPVQKTHFEPPLPYGDWASTKGLPKDDTGIDLVAKLRNSDGLCAIQCKFWAEGKSLEKKDIDSFLADSSKRFFSHRLIIDTTGKDWSANALKSLRDQDPPVTRIGLEDLYQSSIDWDSYISNENVESKSDPKSPYPHQKKAIAKVLAGLKEPGSRGKLLMACGTGKTFTSLRIAEDLVGVGGRVLYLVPSLALMSQTVREWATDTRVDLRSYAVCSDSQVGRRKRRSDDRIDMDVLDLAFPSTTNAELLAKQTANVTPDKLTVVFATYHSLPVVGEAQRTYGLPDFDLVICDEAHRTAGARIKGEEDSHFVQIHDQDSIKSDRRLYMTATPKVYAPSARNRAGKLNAELCSMEDEDIYGPVLYEIGFGAAVERGLLSDYKVIVLTVPAEDVARVVGEAMSRYELKIDDAGKLIGCWRALAKEDAEEFGDDRLSMRRAIAYCRDIKTSKLLANSFEEITKAYHEFQRGSKNSDHFIQHGISSKHVDGTFHALARAERLEWLDSVQPQDRTSHVLSNVRCLSEGVDVPALDAILFMHPRKSQIEVVQAVGRVMRKSSAKQMGYVVLPVVIPSGTDPSHELDQNDTFKVVWQVLNAIRSHDERFEAMLNLMEGGKSGKHLGIIALSDWKQQSKRSESVGIGTNGKASKDGKIGTRNVPEIPFEYDLPAAIRAKIVEKCGNRRYWDEWAVDVAEIAQKHIVRIREMVSRHEAAQDVFQEFLAELRDDLNEGVSESDAIEMLAQHMVTRPVFEALHGDAKFVDQNPISKGMEMVLDVLKPANIEVEAESLDEFYASVARRAKAANTPLARQKIITELYDKFFRNAFPKTASRLGIVYTPIEIVDFILHSVDQLLREEFGESLSSEGVQILDPFTGTGTFVTRMIQSGLIDPESLRQKYRTEIHANEIMLLAYYIAAVNIEEAYHSVVGSDKYERFPNIVLTDTFEMQDGEDLIAGILPENSEQRKKQKEAQIRVIVGNPPWSTGQKSENDETKNQSYPLLNLGISTSYARYSTTTNKNSLYDSYVLAIRWASDRIGESGVIGVVTNAGWLEGIAMDGMRKCLAEEFTSIYVLNLRGNQRTQGERSRKEGGKVFGSGSRAAVAITLFVKNPSGYSADSRTGCKIFYHDIGDYLTREEKLNRVKEFKGIDGIAGKWTDLKPDTYNDWLNQRDAEFERFMVMGDKKGGTPDMIFKGYSQGIKTNRDAWCYNYSELALRENIHQMVRFYNTERHRLASQSARGRKWTQSEITQFVNNDPTKISWTRALKNDLRNQKDLSNDEGRITTSQYRPFTRQHMYFSRRLNEMVYQIPQIFPHAEAENQLICVTGKGSLDDFSCLMVKKIPDLGCISAGQCFPRWLYSKPSDQEDPLFPEEHQTDAHGFIRESALTDYAITSFSNKIWGGQLVNATDLYYYSYGVLHVPFYRKKYATNLRKELPRIPFPKDADEFRMLTEAGKKLGKLHMEYDEVDQYPISFEAGGWEPKEGCTPEVWFRVMKMKHPRIEKQLDKSRVIYNDHITVKEIPLEAYDYMVNGKSAIAWVMDRQCVKTDKASQIMNDANRFAIETMNDPAYPLKLLARVITVSLETIKILKTLDEIEFHPET